MTSVLGHMMELEFRGEYRSWRGCSPEDLFTAPLTKTVKKDMEKVAQTLAEEARKCSVLLLWLDCDLEGENIAFEVVQVCTAANPRLTVLRARFSALIARDVLATLRAPQRPNQHMSEAGMTGYIYAPPHATALYVAFLCSGRPSGDRPAAGRGLHALPDPVPAVALPAALLRCGQLRPVSVPHTGVRGGKIFKDTEFYSGGLLVHFLRGRGLGPR